MTNYTLQANHVIVSLEKGTVYKFVQVENYQIKTDFINRAFEKEFLKIDDDGIITLLASFEKGYAWDGCSPKGNFIDITWGTPDGMLDIKTLKPKTYYASMIHDVLYQYKDFHQITRKETDQLFYKMLKDANFKLAGLYYAVVRIGGGLYGKWDKKNKN